MRVVVLSDTHLRATSARGLPEKVLSSLRDAEVILHAGDVTEQPLLDELVGYAPVHAVLGNNDTGFGVLDLRKGRVRAHEIVRAD